jgi:nucleoid-associated protein YgaU
MRPTTGDDVMDDERAMTYAELAQARSISVASARRMVLKFKWRRVVGNDGLARIMVPASQIPAEPPIKANQQELQIRWLTQRLELAEDQARKAEARAVRAEERADRADQQADRAEQRADAAEIRAEKLRQDFLNELAAQRSCIDALVRVLTG